VKHYKKLIRATDSQGKLWQAIEAYLAVWALEWEDNRAIPCNGTMTEQDEKNLRQSTGTHLSIIGRPGCA